jgi:hypothetical protein
MTNIIRPSARLGVLLVAVSLVAMSCASTPDAVLETGGMNLNCPRQELEVALDRETPVVREYAVACNFMYTRVHCTKEGCRSAPLEPPCVGNLPCFEEDPVTLEWRLPERERLAYAAAHGAN